MWWTRSGKEYVGVFMNSQACPSSSRPIREVQCSSFNTQPFMGRFYQWEPFNDGEQILSVHGMIEWLNFYIVSSFDRFHMLWFYTTDQISCSFSVFGRSIFNVTRRKIILNDLNDTYIVLLISSNDHVAIKVTVTFKWVNYLHCNGFSRHVGSCGRVNLLWFMNFDTVAVFDSCSCTFIVCVEYSYIPQEFMPKFCVHVLMTQTS